MHVLFHMHFHDKQKLNAWETHASHDKQKSIKRAYSHQLWQSNSDQKIDRILPQERTVIFTTRAQITNSYTTKLAGFVLYKNAIPSVQTCLGINCIQSYAICYHNFILTKVQPYL